MQFNILRKLKAWEKRPFLNFFSLFKKPRIFTCVAACGLQTPDQESNPGPLHWKHQVLATGPPGKSLLSFLSGKKWILFPHEITPISTAPHRDLTQKKMEKNHILTELPRSKTVLGEGSLSVLFLKEQPQHGSFEFHPLTCGNDADLSALFSVRDKTCDLSELRCTFELWQVLIYIIF